MTFRSFLKRVSPTLLFGALLAVGCGEQIANSARAGGTGAFGGDGDTSVGSTGSGGGSSSSASQGDGTGGNGDEMQGPMLALPLELLGSGSPNEKVVGQLSLELEQSAVSQVTRLFVRCHRCGFYDPPEYESLDLPVTDVKASYRIVGLVADDAIPWIDLTDDTVHVDVGARAHGGLYGGHRTVDFWVPVDAQTLERLGAGQNIIEFRFNGTDGASAGYRVLDVDFQDDGGTSLSPHQRVFANIEEEKLLDRDSGDIAAGYDLWHQRGILDKSILVQRTIQASCADCHAEDGRDLQYFNYSDHSIIQRSRFHGLSEEEGRQIVAYLRDSLRDVVPHVPAAAPWNPPYQPGPGLDCFDDECTNNDGWAAGAGIDAVLETASEAAHALFDVPEGETITQADVDNLMRIDVDHNVRETPVALQFPDWNDWLPHIHPIDIWTGQTFEDIPADPTHTWANTIAQKMYDKVQELLAKYEDPGKPGYLREMTDAEKSELSTSMQYWGINTWGFLGGGRGQFYNGGGSEVGGRSLELDVDLATAENTDEGGPFSTESFMERANLALTRWNITREWYLSQKYHLDSDQTVLEGKLVDGKWVTHGEKRGWPWHTFSVFYVAPHVCYQGFRADGSRINTDEYYTWNEDNHVVDFFASNQWYQLQMTLNPGARRHISNYPMDWGYHTYYNQKLGRYLVEGGEFVDMGTAHYVRNVQTLAKLAQYVDNEIPLNEPSPDQPAEDYYTDEWVVTNPAHEGRAEQLMYLLPHILLSYRADQTSKYALLDEIQPDLFRMVVGGQIQMVNQLYSEFDADEWARCAPYDVNLSDEEQPYDPFQLYWGVYRPMFCIDRERRLPDTDGDGNPWLVNPLITPARAALYSLGVATEMGVESTRLAAYESWIDSLWP